MKNIGERLKYLREKHGLNQSDFARLLGYKQNSTLSAIESGRSMPTVQVLEKIAESLKADLHWLITGQKSPDTIQVLQKLAKYLSRSIAQVLDERDETDKTIYELEQKKAQQPLSEDDIEDLIYWKRHKENLQQQLNEFLEDQPWVKEALEVSVALRDLKKIIKK